MANSSSNSGKAPSGLLYASIAVGAFVALWFLVFIALRQADLAWGYKFSIVLAFYGVLVYAIWDYVIITVKEDVRVRLINRRTGKDRIVNSKTQLKSIFEEFDLLANEVKRNPIKVSGSGIVELSDDSFVKAEWILRFMPGGDNADEDMIKTFDKLALTEEDRKAVVVENINAIAIRVARSLAAGSNIGQVRKSGVIEKGFRANFENDYLDDVSGLGCSMVSAQLTFDIDVATKETIEHIFKGDQNLELAKKMVEASKEDPQPLTIKEALNFLNAQDRNSNVQKTITEVEGKSGDGLMQALLQLVVAAKAGK